MSYLTSNDIDLATITETWFASERDSVTAVIKDYGYEMLHTYRVDRRGGGVAIVHKNLNIKPVNKKLYVNTFEYCCCKIEFSNHPDIKVICVYRPGPPHSGVREFCDELEAVIDKHYGANEICIISGDFNIHYELNCTSTNYLWASTVSHGLKQLVPCVPTHVDGHTLDLLFANTNQLSINVCDLDIPFTPPDHYPIRFDIANPNSLQCSSINTHRIIKYRKLNDINIDAFKTDLISRLENFANDNTNNNFESEYNNFDNILSGTLDKFAPVKSKNIRVQRPPWMDSTFNKERTLRRKLERKYLRTRSVGDKHLLDEQRLLCVKLSKMKRSEYYRGLFQNADGDQRKLFNIVSKTLDSKSGTGVLPHHSSDAELGKSFNNFYIEKVKKIRDAIPNIELDDSVFTEFKGTILNDFQPVTVNELRDIIKESQIKTCPNDPLPSGLLTNVIDCLLPYLCHVINKSFETGSLNGIKESVIRPLLKKAGLDIDNLNSYRPVHNLVFISKLMEKVVNKQFNEHLVKNNLDLKYQHGYKKHHSTETLILRVIDDILIGFENNSATVMILLDLSAAFDTVDIDKLLTTLKREIGVRGKALSWFSNYLKNRKQTVMINETVSDPLFVLFGVPQGSVLGPILFNIYIRSLSRLISKCGYITGGYADDNHAMKPFPLSMQFNVISADIPQLVTTISTWMNKFALKINPDKTEIIVFCPPNIHNELVINGTILADGSCVRFSKSVKNLGVYLDTGLTLRSHIDNVSSHCYLLLRNIGRIRSLLNQNQIETLVHAVISSRIDYCSSIFYGLNKDVIGVLQKVQNAAIRMIFKLKKRTSLSEYFEKLHWLKVEQRIIFKIILIVFKCVTNMAPKELIDKIICYKDKDKLTLSCVQFKSKAGRRCFSYIGPRLWNEVPFEIKSLTDIEKFKKQLKFVIYNDFHALKSRVFRYIE